MEPAALVQRSIELLAPYLPAAADFGVGVGQEVLAHALYETVARALSRRGEAAALAEFVANPANVSLIKRLLIEEVTNDPAFATRLASAVAAMPDTPSTYAVNQAGSSAGGDIVGRDRISSSNTTTKKTNTGGLVVGVFAAVVILIIVLFLGKIVVNVISSVTSSGLSGSSTCEDYIGSGDTAAKVDLMKKLYVAASKPRRAADPWLLQNTEYYCGQRPKVTLSQMVAEQKDYS